jgi:hypothetical protein
MSLKSRYLTGALFTFASLGAVAGLKSSQPVSTAHQNAFEQLPDDTRQMVAQEAEALFPLPEHPTQRQARHTQMRRHNYRVTVAREPSAVEDILRRRAMKASLGMGK